MDCKPSFSAEKLLEDPLVFVALLVLKTAEGIRFAEFLNTINSNKVL
jgi:hypothetical protein